MWITKFTEILFPENLELYGVLLTQGPTTKTIENAQKHINYTVHYNFGWISVELLFATSCLFALYYTCTNVVLQNKFYEYINVYCTCRIQLKVQFICTTKRKKLLKTIVYTAQYVILRIIIIYIKYCIKGLTCSLRIEGSRFLNMRMGPGGIEDSCLLLVQEKSTQNECNTTTL